MESLKPASVSSNCVNCTSGTVQERLQGLLQALSPPPNILSAPDHLLQTNNPPLDVEIHTSREIITNEERRLQILDESVAHLKSAFHSTLKALSVERDKSKEKIRRHESIISPLRQLPSEILLEIFSFTIPPSGETETLLKQRFSKFGIGDSPWILTHVSTRWRDICLAVPYLWKTIIVSHIAESRDGPLVSYPLGLLEAQLHRSGNAALSLVMQTPNPSREILAALLDSSSRWETLKCTTSGTFLSSLSSQLPLLRSVLIENKSPGPVPAGDPIDVLDAPALRHFTLRRYPSPLVLPWDKITLYRATGTWDSHLKVLPLMVNLRRAWLNLLDGPSTPEHSQSVVPTLQKLYLRSEMPPSRVPATLLLPALTDFSFHGDLEGTSPWIQRQDCALQRIAFSTSARATVMVELFQQFPIITDILIYVDTGFMEYIRELLPRLSDTTPGALLLPNLKRIGMFFNSGRHVTPEFISFIQSRRADASSTLKTVSFAGQTGRRGLIEAADLLTVKELEEQGLTVTIEHTMKRSEWERYHGWPSFRW